MLVWLLGAGTGGAVLLKLVEGAIDLLRGRSAKTAAEHADAIVQRDHAWAELTRRQEEARQDEARHDEDARVMRAEVGHAHARARLFAEYASRLRRILIEEGLTPPEWPVHPDTELYPGG